MIKCKDLLVTFKDLLVTFPSLSLPELHNIIYICSTSLFYRYAASTMKIIHDEVVADDEENKVSIVRHRPTSLTCL